MAENYTGRGNNAGPATEFFPLSGTTASSPAILITATAAPGTTIHTADTNAQDVVFLTYSNCTAGGLTVFTNLGSSATTGQQQDSVAAGGHSVVANGNIAISKLGVVSAWSTATVSLFAFGYVARTYTATS